MRVLPPGQRVHPLQQRPTPPVLFQISPVADRRRRNLALAELRPPIGLERTCHGNCNSQERQFLLLERADGGAAKVVELAKASSWDRGNVIGKSGYATMPGAKDFDSDVARSCAELLANPPKPKA